MDNNPVFIVNELLSSAVNEKASDLHCQPNENSYDIYLRVEGQLRKVESFTHEQATLMVNRLKLMGRLNSSTTHLPQDGHFSFETVDKITQVEIRISTIPTPYGESVALRFLKQAYQIIPLYQLGFLQSQQEELAQLLKKREGLIIVTGPTGSGKTTTLYAAIQEKMKDALRIITIEDPIEYKLSGITQTEVNSDAGYTFAIGLKAILRHDPDVILIGEIRDEETAGIAIKAALTGHLVLATLHTNDVVSAITRLLDLGVPPLFLADALKGVVNQRLIPCQCSLCLGKGCSFCSQTGRKGRQAVFEILTLTESIAEAVVLHQSVLDIKRILQQSQFVSLANAAAWWVQQNRFLCQDIEWIHQT